MLIDFSVEHYRSFGAEQTLNLIASGKLQGHEEHCIPIAETGKSVLRAGVVYGANAAGKSNIVRAILFAQTLIQGTGQIKMLALNHFRFRKLNKPSSFEFRFLVDGQVFIYGFAITQKAVVEEWLEGTSQKGRDVKIFDRKEQHISVGNLTGSFGKGTEFLQSIGTGINDLHIEQAPIPAERLPKQFLEGLQASHGQENAILLGGSSVILQLDPNDPTKVIRRNLSARHRVNKSTYSIPFQDESDGTQRCLNLLPALYHLTTGRKVFVIDELNRSLGGVLTVLNA